MGFSRAAYVLRYPRLPSFTPLTTLCDVGMMVQNNVRGFAWKAKKRTRRQGFSEAFEKQVAKKDGRPENQHMNPYVLKDMQSLMGATDAEMIGAGNQVGKKQDMEKQMNQLVQGPSNPENEVSAQSTELEEPPLQLLANEHDKIPKTMSEPPEGFEWLWIPHISTAVLRPQGWTSAHGQGKWLGMDTYKAVVTIDTPESCKIGLSITAYEGIFTQPLIKNDTPMQLGEFFTSLHMKKAGPPEGQQNNDVLPELVDSWQFTPMDGLDTFGLEYIMNYSEFDDEPSQRGFQYHLHLVFNRHEDIGYEISFRAPYVFWQQAWNTHGKHMIDNLHLNWDDSSPLRFE